MGATYNGNAGGFSHGSGFTITEPVDADPQAAGTYNVAYEKISDAIEWFRQHAGILDLVNAWTASNTFSSDLIVNGAAGDTNAALLTTATPSTRKCLWRTQGATLSTGLYLTAAGGIELTSNAIWNGTNWTGLNGSRALKAVLTGSVVTFYSYNVAATPYADGNFVAQFSADLTTGDVTATRNIVAKIFKSNDSALSSGDFSLFGWDTINTVSGTNARGTISVKGATPGSQPQIILTWKNGALPSVPHVTATAWAVSGTFVPVSIVSVSTTTVVCQFEGSPSAAPVEYQMSWTAML
jgi:hypothetical protein